MTTIKATDYLKQQLDSTTVYLERLHRDLHAAKERVATLTKDIDDTARDKAHVLAAIDALVQVKIQEEKANEQSGSKV